ncbi:MAG: ABC transporter ATP-binding protein [Actinomycetia bacterium]|nr:ABC transporter ATP-binding protein [Actinomycetes bacterium]
MSRDPGDTVVAAPSGNPPSDAFLSVRDLQVHFPTEDGVVKAVNGIDFDLERGRTLGIVGESGSGKSVTSQAILGLHKGSTAQVTGTIMLDGHELISASESYVRRLRGDVMAMVFQDPLSAMHPFYTVGHQISEAYLVHNQVSKREARRRTTEMLDRVGIPNPAARYADYPHQFSGGMRQRAMIAMALVCNPKLLIADEPTTALDVTVQAQILELMKDLQKEFHSAIILITHDLGVVAETCDDVLVMYGGQCVEMGTVEEIFYHPQMPYAWGLLSSMPRMDRIRQVRLQPIQGQPPSLINVPAGCAFHPRCDHAARVGGNACATVQPGLIGPGGGHRVRCHIDLSERQRVWSSEIAPKL